MSPRNTDNNPTKNIGQTHADDTLNGLKNAEKEAATGSTQDTDTNDETNPNKPINYTGSGKSMSPEPKGVIARLWKGKRTKGPMLLIATTILGGGLAFTTFFSPGLLLVHMKETFTGWLDSASPALNIGTNKMFYNKFKESKNGFASSSDGKCNIRCRVGTIDETMKLNFEERGFIMDVNEVKGLTAVGIGKKYTINSMVFPSGVKVKNGEDFTNALLNPTNALHFKKVFNSKTAYFLNSKFGSMLKEKFGLNKLQKLSAEVKEDAKNKVDAAKEKVKETMREALGISDDGKSTGNIKLTETIDESISEANKVDKNFDKFSKFDVGSKIDKTVGPMGLTCAAYNLGRGTSFAIKYRKALAFVAFAALFLTTADQIKAGDADPNVVSALGDQLTLLDENGKSATDSIGYKMAAFNDVSSLSEDDQKYSASISNSTYSSIDGLLSAAILGKLGLSAASKFCMVAGSTFTDIAATCSPEILAAIGSAGTAALPALGVCAVKIVAIQTIIGEALGLFIAKIMQSVSESDLPDLDDNTIGAAVGNSIYTGTAQVMGGMAATYGLKAGNEQEIEQYAIDTASIRQQEDAIANLEAKDTPFDVYNPNSFIGSIALSLNLGALSKSSSFLSSLNTLFAIIPKSASILTNNVGAEANKKADQYGYDRCEDSALKSIGVDADSLCNPTYVMSSSEMNADVYETLDYMIGNDYIDESNGNPVVWAAPKHPPKFNPFDNSVLVTQINPYQLYLDNCANRREPLGETSAAIEDANYEWNIGLMCTGKDASKEDKVMLSNFRSYTMQKSIDETLSQPEITITPTTTENQTSSYLTDKEITDIIKELSQDLNNQSQDNIQPIVMVPEKPKAETTLSCVYYNNCKINGDDTPMAYYKTKDDIFSKLGYMYNKKLVYIS